MTIIMNDNFIRGWEEGKEKEDEMIEEYATKTLYGFK